MKYASFFNVLDINGAHSPWIYRPKKSNQYNGEYRQKTAQNQYQIAVTFIQGFKPNGNQDWRRK